MNKADLAAMLNITPEELARHDGDFRSTRWMTSEEFRRMPEGTVGLYVTSLVGTRGTDWSVMVWQSQDYDGCMREWDNVEAVEVVEAAKTAKSAPRPSPARFTLELQTDPELGALADRVVEVLEPFKTGPVPAPILDCCARINSAGLAGSGQLFDEVAGTNTTTGAPTLRFIPSAKYRAMVEDLVRVAGRAPKPSP